MAAARNRHRKHRLLLTSAAGAVLVTLLILMWQPPGEADGRSGSRKTLGPAAWWPGHPVAKGEPWPSWEDPQFVPKTVRRLEPWLQTRGRDAEGLVAAWELSGDDALLREAAARFPDDARVCLAMIDRCRLRKEPPAEALPWIGRFIAAHPDNPEGWVLKAWALGAWGRMDADTTADPVAAVSALRGAAAMPEKRRHYGPERLQRRLEAALASGLESAAAAREALRLEEAGNISAMAEMLEMIILLGVHAEPFDSATDGAAAAGEAQETLRLCLTAADRMSVNEDGLHSFWMITRKLMEDSGRLLPPDTVVTADGRTAEQVLARLEGEANRLDPLLRVAPGDIFNPDLTDEQVTGLVDVWSRQGERAALEWLAARMEVVTPGD